MESDIRKKRNENWKFAKTKTETNGKIFTIQQSTTKK